MNQTRDRDLLLNVYCLFYYGVLFFFAIDHRLLSQYRPILFLYNRDLTELLLIGTGIPQFVMAHPWLLLLADILAWVLPVVILAMVRVRKRFNTAAGVLFSGFLGLYLLLINLFWQADHEPFMLYLFLSLAFWSNRPEWFYAVLRFCRYYFLYIFVSAAIWKLARGAVFNPSEMSRILLVHHSDLLSAGYSSPWSRVCLYLIAHPALSWWLYTGGVVLEAVFIVGFFTRRWDRWLIGAAVLFVAADQLLMRIPYWTLLIGCVPLLIDSSRRRRPPRGIVLYETTHHENLPALLELCETHFEKVALFLRELSYQNLCGTEDPARRWPKTLFILQKDGCTNRAFIRRLFRFLRRHRSYTHVHLSTLDSNWLLFAFRLAVRRDIRASMTIHAVNEYFTLSFSGLKAVTESLAKFCLHRRIDHYTLFLPAMAERFRQRLPGAVTVCIPSRFYRRPAGRPRDVEPPFVLADDRPFVLVIPGTVDPHRRDYEAVIDFFSGWLSNPKARSLELVILGSSDTGYGAGIIAGLRSLSTDRFHVTAFNGYVSQRLYEQYYTAADLIWAPLRREKTNSEKSPEVYGQTIASGLTADLQLATTPVLAPDWLQLPEPFQVALLPYSSDREAASRLDRLFEDPAFRERLMEKIDSAFGMLRRENFDAAFRLLMALDDLPASDQS